MSESQPRWSLVVIRCITNYDVLTLLVKFLLLGLAVSTVDLWDFVTFIFDCLTFKTYRCRVILTYSPGMKFMQIPVSYFTAFVGYTIWLNWDRNLWSFGKNTVSRVSQFVHQIWTFYVILLASYKHRCHTLTDRNKLTVIQTFSHSDDASDACTLMSLPMFHIVQSLKLVWLLILKL